MNNAESVAFPVKPITEVTYCENAIIKLNVTQKRKKMV